MSALSILLSNLSTYLSQSSTSNLGSDERVRYLELSRQDLSNKHDWSFLHKEAELTVTLGGANVPYDTATLPTDIKGRKIMSIFYAPTLSEYSPTDENEFMRHSNTKLYTLVGDGAGGNELRFRFVDASDADSDGILNDQSTSSSSTTVVTTFLGSPDVPRLILFTPGGTTGDIAAGNIVVVGTDMLGNSLTENVAIVANQTATSVTTSHFRTITSITFPQMDGNGGTFDVGTNNKVGLKIRYVMNLTAYSPNVLTTVSGFPDAMDEAIVLGAVYRIFMKFGRNQSQINDFKEEYRSQVESAWTIYGTEIKNQRRRVMNEREISYQPISKSRF